jgi:hypothetical protein
MWPGTTDSKENTGPCYPSISVGAILCDLALVFLAVRKLPIGVSSMQAILSPQEVADFLFFLMSEISTAKCPYDNAFNGNHLLLYRRGLDLRYGAGTADALEERYRDAHFKGKTTEEWSSTKRKSSSSKPS